MGKKALVILGAAMLLCGCAEAETPSSAGSSGESSTAASTSTAHPTHEMPDAGRLRLAISEDGTLDQESLVDLPSYQSGSVYYLVVYDSEYLPRDPEFYNLSLEYDRSQITISDVWGQVVDSDYLFHTTGKTGKSSFLINFGQATEKGEIRLFRDGEYATSLFFASEDHSVPMDVEGITYIGERVGGWAVIEDYDAFRDYFPDYRSSFVNEGYFADHLVVSVFTFRSYTRRIANFFSSGDDVYIHLTNYPEFYDICNDLFDCAIMVGIAKPKGELKVHVSECVREDAFINVSMALAG